MREDNIEITLKLFKRQFSKWIIFISKKWILILLFSLVGSSIGFLKNYKAKPVYLANLIFTLEDKTSSINSAIGLMNTLGVNVDISEIFSGDNLLALFKTRLIIEETLLSKLNINGYKTCLADYYIKTNKIDSTWSFNQRLKNIDFNKKENRNSFSREKDSVLYELYRNLSENSISISQKNSKISIYNLQVKSNNEQFSKLFCEALYNTTSKFYIHQITQKANLNFEILKKERDSINAELSTSIINSGINEDKSYKLNSAFTKLKTNRDVDQIIIKINNSLYNTINSNLEAAILNLNIKTPLMQIIDEPKYPLEKVEINLFKIVQIYFTITCVMTILFFTIKELLIKTLTN